MANNTFGMAVGEAYVARAFSPTAKEMATALVEQIRTTLRDRLGELDWLGTTSRARAIAKLDAITMQIGYPDRWPDYGNLEIVEGSFALNRVAVNRFEEMKWFASLGVRPVAPAWQAYPAIAGAYYSGPTNIISVTAAQLQAPFFDPDASDATNLATIGAIIGHELTHAFGADGHRYNEFGLLDDWWTPEEFAEYNARAEAIVAQYDQYIVIDSIRQDGRRTLGENIADIGGLQIAFRTFLRVAEGERGESSGGYTPEQRFFLAYAQSRRSLELASALRASQNDSYSAAQWRVNGPLANMPEFARAFACVEGDPLMRGVSSAQIW